MQKVLPSDLFSSQTRTCSHNDLTNMRVHYTRTSLHAIMVHYFECFNLLALGLKRISAVEIDGKFGARESHGAKIPLAASQAGGFSCRGLFFHPCVHWPCKRQMSSERISSAFFFVCLLFTGQVPGSFLFLAFAWLLNTDWCNFSCWIIFMQCQFRTNVI